MGIWTSIKQWPYQAVQWMGQQGRDLVMTATGNVFKANWPPQEHVPRLAKYGRHAQLFLGEHKAVYVDSGDFTGHVYDDQEYVVVNWLGALSNLLASRLFGEGVGIKAPEEETATQAYLDHLHRRNRLSQYYVESALGVSYSGDTVFKVRYDAEQQRIVIETVSPSIWYPVPAKMNANQIEAHILAQIVWDAEGNNAYLWQERHEMRGEDGWITNRVWKAKGDIKRGQISVAWEKDEVELSTVAPLEKKEAEAPTGVNDLLVVHIPNKTSPATGFWGISDYEPLIGIQRAINAMYTQRDRVIAAHTDPYMYGPSLEDADGNVRVHENKYIVIPDEGKVPIGMVTWDARLENTEKALAELLEDFAGTSGADLHALRPTESSGVISGRALKLLQMRTQDLVRGKQRNFEPGLQQVFSVATKLATVSGVDIEYSPKEGTIERLERADVGIAWEDGLPSLRAEEIEEQVMMVVNGVQSHGRAIEVLHGLTEDEAGKVLQRIQAERMVTALEPPAAVRLGSNFESIEPDTGEGET